MLSCTLSCSLFNMLHFPLLHVKKIHQSTQMVSSPYRSFHDFTCDCLESINLRVMWRLENSEGYEFNGAGRW